MNRTMMWAKGSVRLSVCVPHLPHASSPCQNMVNEALSCAVLSATAIMFLFHTIPIMAAASHYRLLAGLGQVLLVADKEAWARGGQGGF